MKLCFYIKKLKDLGRKIKIFKENSNFFVYILLLKIVRGANAPYPLAMPLVFLSQVALDMACVAVL